MATPLDITARINQMVKIAQQSLETEASLGFETLDQSIHELEDVAREAMQARLSSHFWPIIEKLENGDSLAAAEQDMLQMLLVGEAQYYIKSEGDVEQWKEEVARLVEEIRRLEASGMEELDSMLRLQAICRELQRLVPDLTFYFGEKERVQRFNEAIHSAIDRDTRRLLANLIKDMLNSDKL